MSRVEREQLDDAVTEDGQVNIRSIVSEAAVILWWLPSIALELIAMAASRVQFGIVMIWGDVLKAMGQRDAAARLYKREQDRCRRTVQSIKKRRKW